LLPSTGNVRTRCNDSAEQGTNGAGRAVAAFDVDQVHLGQLARLRFSAFDMRTTPEIQGSVTKISADIFVGDLTGEQFYSVELLPAPGELAKLEF
jgi:membrane fusion protein, type I secretion system